MLLSKKKRQPNLSANRKDSFIDDAELLVWHRTMQEQNPLIFPADCRLFGEQTGQHNLGTKLMAYDNNEPQWVEVAGYIVHWKEENWTSLIPLVSAHGNGPWQIGWDLSPSVFENCSTQLLITMPYSKPMVLSNVALVPEIKPPSKKKCQPNLSANRKDSFIDNAELRVWHCTMQEQKPLIFPADRRLFGVQTGQHNVGKKLMAYDNNEPQRVEVAGSTWHDNKGVGFKRIIPAYIVH
jgi:hypothetical protein